MRRHSGPTSVSWNCSRDIRRRWSGFGRFRDREWGEGETRRQGDKGTRRQGDTEIVGCYAVGVVIEGQGCERSELPWVGCCPSIGTAKWFLGYVSADTSDDAF